MAKKRKRTSVASYVSHLESTTSSPNRKLNLSAYHPDLDLSSLSPADSSEYASLLPHCLVHPSTFPASLQKYWRHRFSLFSLYSAGCLLDNESWFSVTPESVAFRIAKRCASDGTVVDLFAGAGGNAIQLAMTCGRVVAVELDELRLRLARWNAKVYGVEDRITFVQGDAVELLQVLQERRKGNIKKGVVWNALELSELDHVDAVFLSPPWGGVDYAQPAPDASPATPYYDLSSIQPIDGTTLFTQVRTAFATTNIAYYLPRNTSLPHLSALATETPLKIEYQYLNRGTKLSSLTAYYGALASDWDDDTDDWRT